MHSARQEAMCLGAQLQRENCAQYGISKYQLPTSCSCSSKTLDRMRRWLSMNDKVDIALPGSHPRLYWLPPLCPRLAAFDTEAATPSHASTAACPTGLPTLNKRWDDSKHSQGITATPRWDVTLAVHARPARPPVRHRNTQKERDIRRGTCTTYLILVSRRKSFTLRDASISARFSPGHAVRRAVVSIQSGMTFLFSYSFLSITSYIVLYDLLRCNHAGNDTLSMSSVEQPQTPSDKRTTTISTSLSSPQPHKPVRLGFQRLIAGLPNWTLSGNEWEHRVHAR